MYLVAMSVLFKPYKIGSMEIGNRFMRSATTSYYSDERGFVRDENIELYRRLAKGGVGLIVKGHLFVTDSGRAHEGMAGISHDYHIPRLKELTDAVHENDGKIVTQLNHGGYNSVTDRAGPSYHRGDDWNARALTEGEIHELVESFGDAAERSMEAGFDGVQIHGAHGYLISQFLSKAANKRDDDYGGSLENRMRLLVEVYDEIRSRVGNGVPVLLKMNCDDFSADGFTVEESAEVARAISRRGVDAVEISGGGFGRRDELYERARSNNPEWKEAIFAGHAEKIREATRPTTMAIVNGIRSLRCMQALVDGGLTDLISMSRPFVREAGLIRRLEAGQERATCTSCGACNSREVFGKTMLRCQLD
ncbi:NADH:flavin oxidoreductase [Candidatus Bathyarchaeota archaeon]|nr:NADH:flavin oxidoreductase [Candidatus Bathyarchaeota archaeon]